MSRLTYHATIPSSHEELSSLRHDLRSWFAGCEVPDDPPMIDVDLVVTELVANAIDHTDAPHVELTVRARPGSVRVEVANEEGSEAPVLTSEWDAEGERGRGLRLVAALAAELSLESCDGRSVVVAELVAEREPVGEA